MNARCENCQKTFTSKEHAYRLLKKAMIIAPMVFGLYYFFTKTDQGKEYRKKINSMIKNACPACNKMMMENIKKLKDIMESSYKEEEESNKNVKKK